MAQNKKNLLWLALLAAAVVAALMGALLFQLKSWSFAAAINPYLSYVEFSVGSAFCGSKSARAKIWGSALAHPEIGVKWPQDALGGGRRSSLVGLGFVSGRCCCGAGAPAAR